MDGGGIVRWVVCFLVMTVGCVASIPSDHGLTADIACEASREVVRLRNGMPPTPSPASDRCENCDGTGVLGDGRITRQCPICKGTGKKPKTATICITGTCR